MHTVCFNTEQNRTEQNRTEQNRTEQNNWKEYRQPRRVLDPSATTRFTRAAAAAVPQSTLAALHHLDAPIPRLVPPWMRATSVTPCLSTLYGTTCRSRTRALRLHSACHKISRHATRLMWSRLVRLCRRFDQPSVAFAGIPVEHTPCRTGVRPTGAQRRH